MSLAIRIQTAPITVGNAVREAIWRHDGGIPFENLSTMDTIISNSVASGRITAATLGFFSAVAVMLSAIGLYGMLTYFVSQRYHEIGVRIALGAKASNVVELVLIRGLKLVACGLAVGVLGSLGGAGLLQGLLFETPPTDLLVTGVALTVFLIIALAACLFPAFRAIRVDPIVTLKDQ